MPTVLLAHSSAALRDSLSGELAPEGFTVAAFADLDSALDAAADVAAAALLVEPALLFAEELDVGTRLEVRAGRVVPILALAHKATAPEMTHLRRHKAGLLSRPVDDVARFVRQLQALTTIAEAEPPPPSSSARDEGKAVRDRAAERRKKRRATEEPPPIRIPAPAARPPPLDEAPVPVQPIGSVREVIAFAEAPTNLQLEVVRPRTEEAPADPAPPPGLLPAVNPPATQGTAPDEAPTHVQDNAALPPEAASLETTISDSALPADEWFDPTHPEDPLIPLGPRPGDSLLPDLFEAATTLAEIPTRPPPDPAPLPAAIPAPPAPATAPPPPPARAPLPLEEAAERSVNTESIEVEVNTNSVTK